MANEVQDYLTLTFVVRRPAGLDELHEVEFEEARALVTDDETQFYSLRPGVSVEARAMGAEPGDWV